MSLNPGRDNESDFETHLNTSRQMHPEKMDGLMASHLKKIVSQSSVNASVA